jgi:hypothetical protein
MSPWVTLFMHTVTQGDIMLILVFIHLSFQFSVSISKSTKQLVDISSGWFKVAFFIQDTTVLHVDNQNYKVRVSTYVLSILCD